jgi:signal transduction histidine kinase
MGLAICQRIIETHSGTIKAENAVDGGATITIELPILHGE